MTLFRPGPSETIRCFESGCVNPATSMLNCSRSDWSSLPHRQRSRLRPIASNGPAWACGCAAEGELERLTAVADTVAFAILRTPAHIPAGLMVKIRVEEAWPETFVEDELMAAITATSRQWLE